MNQNLKDIFSSEKNDVIDIEPNDSKQVVQTVKDRNEGKRGMDLVMDPVTGEMLAIPSNVADKRKDLIKASTIAQGIFWLTEPSEEADRMKGITK